MIEIRRSEQRGPTRFGWLESRHTFSFGHYYDPSHMGVSALRVINDDRVTPGAGFAPHSHRDMEIISFVKRGVIEHKDSMGNTQTLPAGEFQLMSAGRGVTHSEYNPSTSEPLEFLQIWIVPNERGVEPGYQQKAFPDHVGLQLVISPDGRNDTLRIHQDTLLFRLRLDAAQRAEHQLDPGRTAYLHVIAGTIRADTEHLHAGDGATIRAVDTLSFEGIERSDALLFDLP